MITDFIYYCFMKIRVGQTHNFEFYDRVIFKDLFIKKELRKV